MFIPILIAIGVTPFIVYEVWRQRKVWRQTKDLQKQYKD